MGCLRDYVGSTSGVPQIAADLSHRATRQPITDVPVRLAVLFIISYATGLIFSTAVVSPFIIFMFGFGYGGFNVLISLTRSRMKLSTQPSSRPSFRRVASAVLGSTLVLQVTRNQAAEPRGILRT